MGIRVPFPPWLEGEELEEAINEVWKQIMWNRMVGAIVLALGAFVLAFLVVSLILG